jgi:flagellar FliJ protein
LKIACNNLKNYLVMYKFNLEPVLNQRKSVEEGLQKELAILKKYLADEKKMLAAFKKAKKEASKELEQKKRKSVGVFEILLHFRFIEKLSVDIEKQEKRVSDAKKICDKKRENLIEAMKNRKVIEKLKEKGFKQYQQEVAKKEQVFLNEVAVSLFNQKM